MKVITCDCVEDYLNLVIEGDAVRCMHISEFFKTFLNTMLMHTRTAAFAYIGCFVLSPTFFTYIGDTGTEHHPLNFSLN